MSRRTDGRAATASPALFHGLPFWAELAVFAACDFGLTRLGRELTPGPSTFAAFWPASGFLLGALLLSDRRRWIFFIAASSIPIAVFNAVSGQPAVLVAAFAAANIAEALLGAWITLRIAGVRPQLSRLGQLGALVISGPLLGSGVATLPAAWALSSSSGIPFVHAAVRLWFGSALGSLAVAPLLLAWAEPAPGPRLTPGRLIEASGLAALLGGVGSLVLRSPESGIVLDSALLSPVLVWAALRFGPRGTTLSGFMLSLIVLSATAHGRGEFVGSTSADVNALSAQLFCAVALLSVLAMTSVVESRRLSAEALRRSQLELQRIRFATDAASDLIACIEPEGTVVYVNDAFRSAAGPDGSALLGRPIWSFGWTCSAEDWARHWVELKKRGSHTDEISVLVGGPEPLLLEVRSSYLCFDGQEYCVSSGRNLRERRQAEAALRMASVGTLAAGMAHEINNPLSYVLGNLSWMSDELAEVRKAVASRTDGAVGPEEALASMQGVLDEITDGVGRIRDIVRDLKLFSRSSDEETGADVGRALRAAITLSQNVVRNRARLFSEFESVPPVKGNEHRLGQVFLNLIINAAQAIPEGQARDHVLRLAIRPHGDCVVAVEVEDTGCGISPEVLPHIFEPFFTTKAVGAGTGLGLYVCHGIVAGLGGRIEVSSRPGSGSLFRVLLPVSTASAALTHVLAAQ
jgi:signal transduction histidine kinase/integral membrane sensor domain MASE1